MDYNAHKKQIVCIKYKLRAPVLESTGYHKRSTENTAWRSWFWGWRIHSWSWHMFTWSRRI